MRIIPIFLVILSTFIIFYYTNLATPINTSIDDGNYGSYLLNHKPGYVCPLGIYLGQILIPISFIQIYYIYNFKYTYNIKKNHLILLIISYLLTYMNKVLQYNITNAFIFQFIILFIT